MSTGDRTLRYAALTQDAFYGPHIRKLTAGDRLSITAFIEAHGSETPEQWTVSVRDHLLVSDRKAKLVIDDVLTCLR